MKAFIFVFSFLFFGLSLSASDKRPQHTQNKNPNVIFVGGPGATGLAALLSGQDLGSGSFRAVSAVQGFEIFSCFKYLIQKEFTCDITNTVFGTSSTFTGVGMSKVAKFWFPGFYWQGTRRGGSAKVSCKKKQTEPDFICRVEKLN